MAESVHGPDCTCTRCVGFQPANVEASKTAKHGAYADLALGPRVDELAVEITKLVPGFRPSDQIAVRLLALSLARIERASQALEVATAGELARLDADMRSWVNTSRRLVNDLALVNTQRLRLGIDVAFARHAGLDVTTLPATDAEAAEIEEGGGS